MSEDQSVLRTTLLGSLLDAARRNRARGADDVALFESGAVYLAPRRDGAAAAGELPALGARCRSSAAPRRAADRRMRPPTWREPSRRAPTSSPPRACSRRCSRAARRLAGRAGAASRSCIPGARRACSSAASAAGWLGELHPLVAARWDFDGRSRASSSTSARLARRRAVPALRGPHVVPGAAPGPRGRRRRRRPAARVLAVVREAGGELLARAEVFDVYRGEQVGEGRVSLALRLEFRAPDRTLTDEDVAPAREGSSPRCATSWEVSCVADVARRSAPRATRARSPRGSSTATRLRARARHRALATPARALDDLYPHTACRWSSRSSTPSATATSTRRSSPTRTAPPRRSSPSCASAA